MNVLVAFASKHGSTEGIAEAITAELNAQGLKAVVREASDVSSVEPYDAAVVGSAIYLGSWLEEARRFVERYGARLSEKPVWLFSSGPVGREDPRPEDDPLKLEELMAATGARGHRNFIGKLDKSELGFAERLAVRMAKVPEGDFRDWEAIREWAREIASALAAPASQDGRPG